MTVEPMQDGMELDPETLIEVLRRKVAEAAVREADLESAVQLLIQENWALANPHTHDEDGEVVLVDEPAKWPEPDAEVVEL